MGINMRYSELKKELKIAGYREAPKSLGSRSHTWYKGGNIYTEIEVDSTHCVLRGGYGVYQPDTLAEIEELLREWR